MSESSFNSGIDPQAFMYIPKNKYIDKDSIYKLSEIFLSNYDLQPHMVQAFSKNEVDIQTANLYMKKIDPLNDLFIPSSTFLFHELNNLFFFYQEEELEKLKRNSPNEWQRKVLERFDRLIKKHGILHLLKKGLS